MRNDCRPFLFRDVLRSGQVPGQAQQDRGSNNGQFDIREPLEVAGLIESHRIRISSVVRRWNSLLQSFLIRILAVGPDVIFKFSLGLRNKTDHHLEPSAVNGNVLPKVRTSSFCIKLKEPSQMTV